MQERISQLAQDIQDIVHTNRDVLSQDIPTWNVLCSALDVIGDTAKCLEASFRMDMSRLHDGDKYVYIYGALQALTMQQEAVEHLAESLEYSYTRDPLLDEIRKDCTDSVGHPTKQGEGAGITSHFISRATIKSQEFQLRTAYADGTPDRVRDVSIPNLIAKQNDIFVRVLDDIRRTLRDLVR